MGNKLSLGINIVLIVAVGWLMIDRLSGGSTPEAVVPAKDTLAAVVDTPVIIAPDFDTTAVPVVVPDAAAIVAYIDMDSVRIQYKYVADKNAELLKEENSFQASLDRKVKVLQDKYAALEKDPAVYSQAPEDMQRIQNKAMALEQEKQEISEYQQRKSQELMQLNDGLVNQMFKQVTDMISEYSEEHEIDYVLVYSAASTSVFHVNKKYDISAPIIQMLNKQYLSEKRPK